jgi:DNA primase
VSLIAPEIIEQIVAANDIVDVIGEYFPLKRAGAVYKAHCPFHNERTPSFTVNPQRQIFKCFGCGAGGSVLRFVMNYENLDFVGAAKKLAERAGIKIEQAEMSASEAADYSMKRRLLALHAEATEFFHWHLMRKPSAQVARDYLKGRGIGSEIAKSWKLGYAPDEWDAMRQFARSNGYSEEELVGSGLVKVREEEGDPGHAPRQGAAFYDRFRGRVMFPICKDTDEVIGFSGRVLQADAKAAKYINSPETVLFTKGAVLFGLNKSKRALINAKSAIVCEGQLDLITAFENGVQNVVAPQGTAFTPRQANILRRFVEEVVLCFDADTAGEKAAERSLESLLSENLLVRVAEMPPGEDPDSMIRGQGAAAFKDRISAAKDFFDFQLDRDSRRPEFGTTRGRIQSVRRLAGFASLIKDQVTKEAVASRITTRMGLSPADFRVLLTSRKPADFRAAPEVAQVKPVELSSTGALICVYALRDDEARKWLLAQDWRKLLRGNEEADLIRKLFEADIVPSNPNTYAQLTGILTEAEEAAVSTFLRQRTLPATEHVAQAWVPFELEELRRTANEIRSRFLGKQISFEEMQQFRLELNSTLRRIAEVRLAAPGMPEEQQETLREEVRNRLHVEKMELEAYLRQENLPAEITAKLQKEILDLQNRLSDIPPPLSPSL